MFEIIPVHVLHILLAVAWLFILIYAIIQYRYSKNSPLLVRSLFLVIAFFAFRFFSVYSINALYTAADYSLFNHKDLEAFFLPFFHPMALDMMDTIVTFAVLFTIFLGIFGRQRIEYQNELGQFLRLKSYAERMKRDMHRKSSYISLLESVSAIKKLLLESSTKESILTHLCELLGKVPHYRVVWIGLQREDTPVLDIAYRADLADPPYLTKEFYVTLDEKDPHSYGPTAESMRTGKTVVIEDTQSDPRFESWKYLAKSSGLHSVVSIPMKVFNQQKRFGVITIYGDVEHRFSNEEIRILEELIQNVSSAIAYHEAEALRKQSAHELKNTAALLQNIISTAPVRIFWKDTKLRYLGCNGHFLHDAGLAHTDEIIGKRDTELVWAEHADAYNRDDLQVIRTKNPIINRVERQGEMWLLTNKAPLYDEEHNIIGIVGSYIDITLQRLAELYLKENEQRFRELLNALPNISVQGYDKERKVIYWNKQSELLYGYSEEEVLGRRLEDLIIPQEMYERSIEDVDKWIHKNIAIPASELELRKKDGSKVLVYSSHVMLRSKDGEPEIFSIDLDLTQQKEAEKALERLANYDVLTQLPNRHFFLRHVKALINKAERSKGEFALFFIDLDDFKLVNDTYGHEHGDFILIEVSKRLQSILRDYDFVARYGGDEFIVTIEYEGDEELIRTIAEKIISTLKEPYFSQELMLQIGSSIGISLYPHDASTLELLLKQADQAMYRAKEKGKNRFKYYGASDF